MSFNVRKDILDEFRKLVARGNKQRKPWEERTIQSEAKSRKKTQGRGPNESVMGKPIFSV